MPNWAFTEYSVIGEKEQLDELYFAMKELEENAFPFQDNGFGKNWLGNLVARLGGNPSKIYCRGKWDNAVRNEEAVFFSVESSWVEMEETRLFLEERFPGIKIYFQSVTDESWQTNDKDALFYCDRYVLCTEERGEDYYPSLSEVIAEIVLVSGNTDIKTFDDCKNALETHYEGNEDACYYLEKFDILD